MGDWLSGAWDSFTGLFGGSDPAPSAGWSDFMPNSGGSGDWSNFMPNDGGSGYSWTSPDVSSPTTKPPNTDPTKTGASWYENPAVIGAAITAGAGYLNNMNGINANEEALKAKLEQEKMNQMLELAKLKYQLQKGGSSSGGGRRGSGGSGGSGGGASGPTRQQINAQYNNQLISGYNALGGALGSVYK